MAQTPKNEGEGSRSGARAYNKDTQGFIKSGKVDEKAHEARKAVEGEEKQGLEQAERVGRQPAKEFDPNVRRDYTKPTRLSL